MSYMDLFSSINCQCIIFFEDDFRQVAFEKKRMLYDIARMDLQDRESFLSEVFTQSSCLKKEICAFLECVDGFFDKIGAWRDSVVYGDITSFFHLVGAKSHEREVELEMLYNAIEDEEINKVYNIGAKYGIGVSQPIQYDSIFTNYILFNNRAKPFRVYTDFSASTAKWFSKDIDKSTNVDSVVCIIDNQLGDAKRAGEIIQAIKDSCKNERKNVVGCVFSSQDLFEEISEDAYFEYVPKTNIGSLETCLAKSAYNYYLAVLKRDILTGLNTAFESAQKSKGIAYYLSRKAMKEGESEYQIINDWIRVLATNAYAEPDNIKQLISLSRVINNLEDTQNDIDDSLQKLNTLETFDYAINEYFLPVAAGDIFTDEEGNWYVLVGQDCDMARSASRHPKNAIAELLLASTQPQTEFKKWANNLEKALIFNFRRAITENCVILQVDYQKRKYIANEILNLCVYSNEGVCRISLTEELDEGQAKLMPQYMIDYYHTLQDYFKAVKTIKAQVKDAFDIINNPEQVSREKNPMLISINDFSEDGNSIMFALRRVCRLTPPYISYLFKLFLEYRGRQPFQTINLARRNEVSLPVFSNNSKTDYSCVVQQIENPNSSNPKSWCWLISRAEITRILEQLGLGILEYYDDNAVLEQIQSEFRLSGGKQLVIEKAKDKIKFSIK